MGECNCSNIAIMQLFHELKQQFPALPDNVISQCIAQNSHDKESCAKSLREAQDSRPPPGAFPPPGPQPDDIPVSSSNTKHFNKPNLRAHRPSSLDIGQSKRCYLAKKSSPASAPADYKTSRFFEENSGGFQPKIKSNPAFEVNVNVACNSQPSTSYPCNENSNIRNSPVAPEHTRSFTSVSLTLRPPSQEPQIPVEVCSRGQNLTYSSSSLDPQGFKSRLQISIGSGKIGGIAASRTRPATMNKPSGSMIPQYTRFTCTTSAPNTPSAPMAKNITSSGSLPVTPTENEDLGVDEIDAGNNSQFQSILNQVDDSKKSLILEQLERKDRLSRALNNEIKKLEEMKKEVDNFSKPLDPNISLQEMEAKLRNEIHQLQQECDMLAEEVDEKLDPRVPLGETSEEFYQSIYTGQQYTPSTSNNIPPPLPSQPPAWEPISNNTDNQDADEPSWVCQRCTFDNHPLMNKCEQCDMPKNQGTSAYPVFRVNKRS